MDPWHELYFQKTDDDFEACTGGSCWHGSASGMDSGPVDIRPRSLKARIVRCGMPRLAMHCVKRTV